MLGNVKFGKLPNWKVRTTDKEVYLLIIFMLFITFYTNSI